ncbi:protein Lst7p [Monosporozyma servazzii]
MNSENALISLTHFCDKHGPRIISVTQCSNIDGNNDNINIATNGNESSIQGGENLLVPNYPIDSYCDSCLLQFPTDPKSQEISSPVDPNPDSATDVSSEIRSMRTILNSKAFVTTQYSSIRFQKLNSITRKVFSEETMIYDCSPFIFSDDIRGLNLSMGFKLYDENARGNERRYCLILTIDQSDIESAMNILSHNWNFILLGFKKIISYIIDLHQQVLVGMNDSNDNINNLDHMNHSSSVSPTISTNSHNTVSKLGLSSMDGSPFMGNYLRANKTKIAKNLVELTNENSIFVKLHKWNAYLLSSLINNE